MKCAFCQKDGKFTCARCHMVRYCCREHQQSHWKEHKTSCQCYRIEENATMGRFLTTQPGLPGCNPPPMVKAGQRILHANPVLVGPRLECPSPVCLTCLKTLSDHPQAGRRVPEKEMRESPVHCRSCQFAFCSQECIQEPSHANQECKIIAQLKELGGGCGGGGAEKTDSSPSSCAGRQCQCLGFEAILPLRLLMAWDEKKFLTLLKLESHVTDLENQTTRWNAIRTKVIKVLSRRWRETLVEQACGLILTNTFEVMKPNAEEPLLALYEAPSLMNHDCIGNTRLVMSPRDWKLTVYASIDIGPAQPILFNYVTPLDSLPERRRYLKRNKFFECTCHRCQDPTDAQTFVSALKCPECSGPVVPKNLEKVADWACHTCAAQMLEEDVLTAYLKLERLQEQIAALQSERELQYCLRDAKGVAFPSHGVICALLQKLIRLMQPQASPKPNHVQLELKRDYCSTLKDTLDQLEPGLSLGRGIVLYEFHSTLVQLANLAFERDQSRVTDLMASLLEAKQFLVEAQNCLDLEPAESLVQAQFAHMKDDLEELDNYIELVKYL